MRFRSFLIALCLLCVLPVLAQDNPLVLTPLGTYKTNTFDEGGAEIVAYHAASRTLYVVNGAAKTIDLLDITDPTNITLKSQLSMADYGDAANSVAVYGDLVAVAVQADPKTDNGSVVFFTPDGGYITRATVGALPDMVVFTSDGMKVLTANEGEPNDDYSIDPEGSVSIIDLSMGIEMVTDDSVTTIGFADVTLPDGVRIYGPNATQAQDIEPEYIAISDDNALAYVTLQENNALAIVDLMSKSIVSVVALGLKDHSVDGNGLDLAKDDGKINITTHPVFGMYQPDGIAFYATAEGNFLVTANEGDTRDYDTYSEEGEIGETPLDPEKFPNAEELANPEVMGGAVVMMTGDTDGDGDLDVLLMPGARSMSIWSADGVLVWDSGDQIEQFIAATFPDDFNSNHVANDSFDNRSDNKGPEPEGVTVANINGAWYAFVGLERMGGIVIFDISNPTAPVLVGYTTNRDFAGDPEAGTAGDLGPEGLVFIDAESSPNGKNLLVVANEISGSTTIWQIGE
jgi:hypothetical protein